MSIQTSDAELRGQQLDNLADIGNPGAARVNLGVGVYTYANGYNYSDDVSFLAQPNTTYWLDTYDSYDNGGSSDPTQIGVSAVILAGDLSPGSANSGDNYSFVDVSAVQAYVIEDNPGPIPSWPSWNWYWTPLTGGGANPYGTVLAATTIYFAGGEPKEITTSSGSSSNPITGRHITITWDGNFWIIDNGYATAPNTTVLTVSTTAVTNHKYVINGSGVAVTLPAAAAVGDTLEIIGYTGSWTIAQASGQSIKLAGSSTTTGASGYVASANANSSARLICVVANDTWVIVSSETSITVH
jgi:hypothetical protein